MGPEHWWRMRDTGYEQRNKDLESYHRVPQAVAQVLVIGTACVQKAH